MPGLTVEIENKTVSDTLMAYIYSISMNGVVTIQFNEDIVVP
jgi:hypothetical protein